MKTIAKLAMVAMTLSIAPVHAGDSEAVTQCCGIVSMTIRPDGTVTGSYEHPRGRLYGQVGGEGEVRGVRVQPGGFHTCRRLDHGSRYWGRFAFEDIASPMQNGTWGCCDEEPPIHGASGTILSCRGVNRGPDEAG